ncbi:synaptonemal complex protein 2-like isoform X2 [Ctenopharyngodon idella]|uniref:synaptonemal complex protein 2-like isoform X2 n=1 Tax=Ctenopharyngodon idella TaxID=7959 RepID=UPI002230A8FE|nr:synaptonemal complex protein 2-like isoform X2 [Ctenopharyngodon idella]
MSFMSRFHDAFVQNNVNMAIMILIEEKSSVSLTDRLDEVVIKELHKNELKNVSLILQAIEHLISKDKDSIQTLVHHGLVVKMLNWFEMASEYLKEQHKPPRDAMKLIEVFYEVAMSLCQIPIAGSNKILDIFLLRFGAVVLDYEVPFCLRLEAIRTINSMLDSSPKDIRKKLCQSDDHTGLLEDLAKALTDIGDYEMQVAISEALCRMTPKKLREDFAGKWFSFRSFASAFTSIRDKDFETDCRTFLNELNSYFGNSRRVFSFPCIQAFLDSVELFKPEDEFLKEFWVDFNIGTSTISFFVNDPKNTLWELIHLPKDVVSMYDLQERDDQKILSVHMSTPIFHGEITGKMVKIIFSSEHNIQTALTKVFAEKPQSASASKDTLQSGPQYEQTVKLQKFSSPPAGETKGIHQLSLHLSGPSRYSRSKVKGTPGEDIFHFKDHSDSEVILEVSQCLSDTFDTERSGKSHDKKPKTITFMAALWRYQVERAKTVLFCQTPSSNGSTKSLPDTLGRIPVKKKIRVMHSEEGFLRKDTPHTDYSRRKPRTKGKLRVLPLSSPSSNEEEFSKYSTPKQRLQMASEDWQSQVKLGRSVNIESSLLKETTADSGFQNKSVSETSLQAEELDNVIEEEHCLDKETPLPQRTEALESSELYVGLKGDKQLPRQPTFQPRRLFLSSPLEDAAERITEVLMEDEESEEELGAGVRAAFNSFKTQLRAHFSSRYKKIEARSLQSLTDCQRNVTSLLGTVHNQRLEHLEQFQNTVVQQLECLEQDCLSLKTIEKETVNFWQSESDTVRAFCDRQQKRLDSLLIPNASAEASFSLSARREAKITVPTPPRGQSSMVALSETTTADPS